MANQLKFPKDFLWGASTSAHQVEGGLHNQWTVWELENAKSMAVRAPYRFKHLDSWSKISREAQNPNNYVSGQAVDHFNKFEDDLNVAKQLNFNSLRFGIEWARVEPKQGEWDISAIEYYRNHLKRMKQLGITPVVTLFHFTLPEWFANLGGFEKQSNVKYFTRFVERILDEMGSEISWVVTINEPTVYVNESYWAGDWPPNKTNKLLGLWVLMNLFYAHRKIHQLTKGNPRYKISMAHQLTYFYPGDDAKLSRFSAWAVDLLTNRLPLRWSKKSSDFIAINFYFSQRIFGYRIHNPENNKVNDLGWNMQPADIKHVLEDIGQRYELAVLITENGLADSEDGERKWWISETIKGIQLALNKEVNVVGYLHWSLLDNFEWDKGFWPKFGLVAVNRVTMTRSIKPSGKWFGQVIEKLRK